MQEETSFEARRKHNLAQNELLKSMIGLVYIFLNNVWSIYHRTQCFLDSRNTPSNSDRGDDKTKRKAQSVGGRYT